MNAKNSRMHYNCRLSVPVSDLPYLILLNLLQDENINYVHMHVGKTIISLLFHFLVNINRGSLKRNDLIGPGA